MILARIWAAALLYALVFLVLGADRYAAHRSAEDLGIFYQSIASAFSGFSNTIEGASHFTVHFSPVLYLLAPLVWIFHSPLPLVAVQAAVNATIPPALFLIARKRVPERTAFWIAALAFIYPPLCGVTFTDFHENGLVPAIVIWLLYAVDARKFVLAFVFLLAALGAKEDQALFLAAASGVGAVLFYRSNQRAAARACATACALCIVVFVGYFTLVRPLAGAHGGWHPAVFYTQTKADAVATPVRAITDRLGYLVLAFAPLVLLPFRSRAIVLAILPFAEVLLSRAPVTYTMGQHYAAVWIPYALFAYALGAASLYARAPATLMRVLATGAALCALVFLVANPLHPKYFLRIPQARDAQLDAFIATLPPGIEVGTQEEAFTHMGFYRGATLGMEQYPQYALFDWNYPDSNWVIRDGPRIKAEVARNHYRITRNENGIVLYQRVGAKPPNAAGASPAW